jgi:hypothetical protein
MKKITHGKWMGIITLINIMVMLYITLIIAIYFSKVNLDHIIIVDKISFGVFAIVWSYVFGSGTVKKFKNIDKKEGEK